MLKAKFLSKIPPRDIKFCNPFLEEQLPHISIKSKNVLFLRNRPEFPNIMLKSRTESRLSRQFLINIKLEIESVFLKTDLLNSIWTFLAAFNREIGKISGLLIFTHRWAMRKFTNEISTCFRIDKLANRNKKVVKCISGVKYNLSRLSERVIKENLRVRGLRRPKWQFCFQKCLLATR